MIKLVHMSVYLGIFKMWPKSCIMSMFQTFSLMCVYVYRDYISRRYWWIQTEVILGNILGEIVQGMSSGWSAKCSLSFTSILNCMYNTCSWNTKAKLFQWNVYTNRKPHTCALTIYQGKSGVNYVCHWQIKYII